MIIRYTNKESNPFETDLINLLMINYEITEKDMLQLQAEQPISYEPMSVLLTQDDEVYDLLIDNVFKGKIIEGGLTTDGKYILTQYIVYKGLEEFIKLKEPTR